MSRQWLEETENLLQSIQEERQALAEEHQRLGKELAAKDEEISHWQAVLASYKKRQGPAQPSLFLHDPEIYEGMSNRQVILAVRDQNQGFIPMWQVTEIVKGKASNPAHAASVAYSALGRLLKQGKVKKVRPGYYWWSNGSNGSQEASE